MIHIEFMKWLAKKYEDTLIVVAAYVAVVVVVFGLSYLFLYHTVLLGLLVLGFFGLGTVLLIVLWVRNQWKEFRKQ